MAAFSKDDFSRLRFSLAIMLILFAASAAAVLISQGFLDSSRKAHMLSRAALQENRGRLARAQDEEQELKHKITRFSELSARGYFGPEQRLDWIELLQGIKTGRKLIGIEYEFAPQQTLDPAILPAEGKGQFQFLASPMQIKLQLLHEGDLVNLLNDLRAAAPAYLRVRKCDVSRLSKQSAENAVVPPQLSADCTIDWITIHGRKEE